MAPSTSWPRPSVAATFSGGLPPAGDEGLARRYRHRHRRGANKFKRDHPAVPWARQVIRSLPPSKRETCSDSDLPRRLNLRSGQDLGGGLAEVGIWTTAEGQRCVVIVVLHDLLIEEIEDVCEQRDAPIVSKFQIVGSLEVGLALE